MSTRLASSNHAPYSTAKIRPQLPKTGFRWDLRRCNLESSPTAGQYSSAIAVTDMRQPMN
jgi:hypothetical protein